MFKDYNEMLDTINSLSNEKKRELMKRLNLTKSSFQNFIKGQVLLMNSNIDELANYFNTTKNELVTLFSAHLTNSVKTNTLVNESDMIKKPKAQSPMGESVVQKRIVRS